MPNTDLIHSLLPRLTDMIRRNGGKFYAPLGLEYYSGYGENLFDWELYLDTLALGYFCPDFYAVNGLRTFLHNQRADGFVPRRIYCSGEAMPTSDADPSSLDMWQAIALFESEEHCKPFLCQTALIVSRLRGDASWLTDEDFRRLKLYLDHWLTAWDPRGAGLSVWGSAPHSGCDTQFSRSGVWRSRFCEAIDLNCYIYRDLLAAAELASSKNLPDDDAHLRALAESKKSTIQDLLWDEDEGMYFDIDARTGESLRVKSAATFIPLWAGIATPEQARLLVERHLRNPEEFATAFPVASYARSDPDYTQFHQPPPGSDERYYLGPGHCNWRGGMWPHWNYMFAHGLADYGYGEEAALIADKFLEASAGEGGPYEWYNAETGQGCGGHPFLAGASVLGVLVGTELEASFDPTRILPVSDALSFTPLRDHLSLPAIFTPASS